MLTEYDTEAVTDLFALLRQYDPTWQIVRESECAALIENEQGQQIHASTLVIALRKAIAFVTKEYGA